LLTTWSARRQRLRTSTVAAPRRPGGPSRYHFRARSSPSGADLSLETGSLSRGSLRDPFREGPAVPLLKGRQLLFRPPPTRRSGALAPLGSSRSRLRQHGPDGPAGSPFDGRVLNSAYHPSRRPIQCSWQKTPDAVGRQLGPRPSTGRSFNFFLFFQLPPEKKFRRLNLVSTRRTPAQLQLPRWGGSGAARRSHPCVSKPSFVLFVSRSPTDAVALLTDHAGDRPPSA